MNIIQIQIVQKINLNKSFRKVNSDILLTNPIISIDKTYCANYFPTILDNSTNVYFNNGTLGNINIPTDTTNMVIYNNLLAFKVPNNYDILIGDVVEVTSGVVEANLVVNKIVNANAFKVVYAYSNFNGNIINNLYRASLSYNQSNTLRIRNLNTYTNNDSLVQNFNNHIMGLSYEMVSIDDTIVISALFSNVSSYYNLDTQINIGSSNLYNMKYTESYIKFGYETKYNIEDYLMRISPSFTSGMEFNILPKYYDIPIDMFENINIISNKLTLKSDLLSEWKSILINTFVDIEFNSVVSYERLLIVDKVYDSTNDTYEIYFDKNIEIYNGVNTIGIVSRNTLRQISSDLSLLNNIYKPKYNKVISGGHQYDTFEKQLKQRFYTDSYAKALLSNEFIKQHLTSIVYIDYNYDISMNVINLETNSDNTITVISNNNEDGNGVGPQK